MQGEDYFHSQENEPSRDSQWEEGRVVHGSVKQDGAWERVHAWMVQNGAWKDGRGRGCMHGWYRMVHGRMGGVEDACMDGTEWCMEGWAG